MRSERGYARLPGSTAIHRPTFAQIAVRQMTTGDHSRRGVRQRCKKITLTSRLLHVVLAFLVAWSPFDREETSRDAGGVKAA